MKRFVIERMVPGIGNKTAEGYREDARISNEALAKLAPRVQWVQSFFAGDMTYCVYLAEDAEDIRRHAELSGFPANKITQIKVVVDPTTAEAA
jgi:hypothetical protein